MTVRLHIGEQDTCVSEHDGPAETRRVVLPFGSQAICRRHFRAELPTAAELEAAIEAVEDALMPAIPRLRGLSPVLAGDADSAALIAAAGVPDLRSVTLDLVTVEHLFSRLARVAHGHPAASEGLPARGTFAGYLLILRELMHHAGWAAIGIAPPTTTPPKSTTSP